MRILLHVIRKEFLQLRRDRRMIPVLIVGPIIQLLALGYAANTDVTEIPTVLVDLDRTASSRALTDRFTGSGYFELVGTEESVAAVDRWLALGRAQVALVIGAGYGKEEAAGRAPSVQVLADGTDSNSAVVGLGYASRIISGASSEMVRRRIEAIARRRAEAGRASWTSGAADGGRPGGAGVVGAGGDRDAGAAGGVGREGAAAPAGGLATVTAPIEIVPRIWYNPDLKSRWFYVPAILAMTLLLMTLILPSMAVVREKEIGTLEQIIVTPIRPWQLMLGKLLPFAIIGVVNLILVTALVVFLFGVPLRGSFVGLLVMTLPYLVTNLGLGLLVSTIVRNQQQAMMASMFFLMVPFIYLSGLIFPIENMPALIKQATYAIPLRYYVNVIRGVFLKGSGVAVLWPETLILAGFAAASITLASLRFRKRLD